MWPFLLRENCSTKNMLCYIGSISMRFLVWRKMLIKNAVLCCFTSFEKKHDTQNERVCFFFNWAKNKVKNTKMFFIFLITLCKINDVFFAGFVLNYYACVSNKQTNPKKLKITGEGKTKNPLLEDSSVRGHHVSSCFCMWQVVFIFIY